MAASAAFQSASVSSSPHNAQLSQRGMPTSPADAISDDAGDNESAIAVSRSARVSLFTPPSPSPSFLLEESFLSLPLSHVRSSSPLPASHRFLYCFIDRHVYVSFQMIMDGASNLTANQHIRFGPMLLKPTKKLVSQNGGGERERERERARACACAVCMACHLNGIRKWRMCSGGGG